MRLRDVFITAYCYVRYHITLQDAKARRGRSADTPVSPTVSELLDTWSFPDKGRDYSVCDSPITIHLPHSILIILVTTYTTMQGYIS